MANWHRPNQSTLIAPNADPSATNNPSAIIISWQSVSNRTYFLQRATNLGPPATFSTIQTNIPGLPGTTSFTDTNALGPGPYVYRVGVQ